MARKLLRLSLFSFVLVSLLACEQRNNADLNQYIAETIRRPAGSIEPLPSFRPYEAFSYSATTERSPFEPPVKALDLYFGRAQGEISPELTRRKEFLENFPLEDIRMVGSIERDGEFWVLVSDGAGDSKEEESTAGSGIHRVSVGNYMGLDHGKIISVTPSRITLVEIVSDGVGGWIERPRTIQLTVQE